MIKEKYWQKMDAFLEHGANTIVPVPFTAAPQDLAQNPSFVQASFELMQRAYKDLHERWKGADRNAVSNELWRWKPKLVYKERNHEREVGLERQIAAHSQFAWTNQVPTSSGLFGPGGRRSAVDLVHRLSPDSFELIELKLRSDTPEYAAREIIIHGLLFLLARKELGALPQFTTNTLLTAKTLRLQVLAPFAFYQRDARWLEVLLDKGIGELCRQMQIGVAMSFAFATFPKWFAWPEDQMRLGEAVAGRHSPW
jgi:hypothetical protein